MVNREHRSHPFVGLQRGADDRRGQMLVIEDRISTARECNVLLWRHGARVALAVRRSLAVIETTVASSPDEKGFQNAMSEVRVLVATREGAAGPPQAAN